MTLGLSLSGLDDAWARRLRADAAFAAAVGTDSSGAVRLYRGWPRELLLKPINANLPRVTFYVEDRAPAGTASPPTVVVASDVWAWHDLDGLDAVDEAMMQAMSGEHGCVIWYDSTLDIVVSSSFLDGSDPPDTLPRRRRRWMLAAG